MSREHPHILYIGDTERADAFRAEVEPLEWAVHTPEEAMEALAMYITYMPDLIILDTSCCCFWEEIYNHFRSIRANRILLLTDRSRLFDGIVVDYVLPSDMSPTDLKFAITNWFFSLSQLLKV